MNPSTLMQDVRYAMRTLRRSPTFAIVAVLTLAIGIGAPAVIFTFIRAVLLRPLPYREPDRLIEVTETNPLKGWTHTVASPANYADWRATSTSFEGLAAFGGTDDKGASAYDLVLTGSGEPQQIKALLVTGDLFRVLGVAPLAGRTFTDQETFEGSDRVAVISYGLWRSLFSGDPAVVGRAVSLSGRTYTVVGVMPPTFFFPGRDVQIWVPFGFKPSVFTTARRPHSLHVVGRLGPGVTLERARSEMTAIARDLERRYPDTNTQMGVRLDEWHSSLAADTRVALLMLLAAVGLLYAIVCLNVANLQFGRAAGRMTELAIRRALGASRGRLVGQLTIEALIVSALGGASGLWLADVAGATLRRFAPSSIPLFAELRVDSMVVLFGLGLTVLAPVLFGVLPALAASRSNQLAERSASAKGHTGWVRDVLVGCEVGLSIVLVVGAVLLIRSFRRLEQVDPGFATEHVITFKLRLPPARYADDRIAVAADNLERSLREEPGVEAAGATSTLALRGYTWTGDATLEGRAADDYERELRHVSVTPGYFKAMGIRLIAGRLLDERDGKDQKVTIVNETLARVYFRGQDPVGRRIKFARPQDNEDWMTVVGVVADSKQDAMSESVKPQVFSALANNPQNRLTFVVRTALDPVTLGPIIRRHVSRLDKDLVSTDFATLQAVVDDSMGDQRFRTTLLTCFAGAALFLAALGIYGVLAFFVIARSREIGIRMALGAQSATVFRMVVRQGMLPVIAGAAAGILIAFPLAQLMRSLLFAVEPSDPISYAATAIVLVGVALSACAVPAWRAVRVNPIAALREL